MSTKFRKPTVCSLFSGGGLFDAGFLPDFELIWANELNPYAAMCYAANVGDHIRVGDISTIPMNEIPTADVFIGGPPCIDFSTAGTNRGVFGDYGKLTFTYMRIIEAKRPKAFVFENVIGLLRRHKEILHRLIHAFERIGYRLSVSHIDCAEFGVPQHRDRIFIVGIRSDLGFEFTFPKPPMILRTVRDAIGDLPDPEFAKVNDCRLGTVPNHLVTWTSPTPERIQDVLQNPRPNQWRGIRRLLWDQPSYTISAHLGKDGREWIHPSVDRRITVREALRIMGVPDSFVIPQEVLIRQQYFIAGNGVPTLVARELSTALRTQLKSVSSMISVS